MKGITSVNPIFEPTEITHPNLHSLSPLVCTDNHNLYLKSSEIRIRWQHKSIINACMVQKYGTLIVLSEEGKLHIFTQNLNQIARIPWESKYSVGLEFLQSNAKGGPKGYFLMIGATDIELQYVKIYSNVKSTKFVSSMNFAIEKKEKYIADPETKLQWNKGYNYDCKQNLLYVWSSKDINFYQLQNLQLKSRITSLTRKQMSITYVLYNNHYKYTITGLINGQIKVWRLPTYQNQPSSSKDYILIHKYIQHSKQVDKIIQGIDERIIISSSEEMQVCLWSLQTFQLLRLYDFLADYSAIFLLDAFGSWAIKDGLLGKLKYGKNLQFVTDVTSEIISVSKFRKQPKLDYKSPIQSLQITLASNLGFQIRDEQLNTKDLNKIEIQYMYPPLKAKGIQQILSSPYTQNQYFLLVENGQIFRLRIENSSGKIEQSYNIERTKDVELHQLNQSPTYMKFLHITPPQFDSEINENTIEKKQKNTKIEIDAYLDLKLIVVGCNKGTVVFLKTHDFEFLYTRVTYHRQAILSIQGFKANGLQYLVTMCSERYIKFVRFDSEKAACILSLFTGDSITIIKGLQDRLAVVLKKGFFQIFQLSNQQRDYSLRDTKSTNHEQQILAIDNDPQRRLVLTAACDNRIKIWTYNKVHIFQIILDEGLKSAIWFRPLQMVILHGFKLLYFRNIGLKISQTEIQEADEQFIEKNEYETISIEQAIKLMKQLKQDIKFEIINGYKQKQLSRLPDLKAKQVRSSQRGRQRIELKQSFVSEQSPKRHEASYLSQQKKKKTYIAAQEEVTQKARIPDSDLQAVRKHIEDMSELRKHTNESLLPKIKPKSEDAFDNFMRSKLINKKILTRRDITLNRIIMKNIIKEHFGADNDITSHLKLDF